MTHSQAWSERRSTLEQERRFKRLISLHTLSDSWIKTLNPEVSASHKLERMAKVTLNPNLWQFEKNRLDQLPLSLEELVGAQDIDGFLFELNQTIWLIQSSTLESTNTATPDQTELQNILEQASWNHGRSHAEAIWGDRGNFSLREGVEAFLKTHIYGDDAFLIERNSPREVSLIWRRSPLHNESIMNSPALGLLCKVHEHWIRGFIYGTSRNTRVNYDLTKIREATYPRFTLL